MKKLCLLISLLLISTTIHAYLLDWQTLTTSAMSASPTDWAAGIYFKGYFYRIGGDTSGTPPTAQSIYRSYNGIDWSAITLNADFTPGYDDAQYNTVLLNSKLYLIITSSAVISGKVWSSTNGADWTAETLSAFSGEHRRKPAVVAAMGYIWVVGGLGTNPNAVFKSNNGADWITVTLNAAFADNSCSVGSGRAGGNLLFYNNKLWLIGGGDTNTSYGCPTVYSSTDGADWDAETLNAEFGYLNFGSNAFVYQNKMWLIGGKSGSSPAATDNVWYSTDGKLWTLDRPLPAAIARYAAAQNKYSMYLYTGIGSSSYEPYVYKSIYSSPTFTPTITVTATSTPTATATPDHIWYRTSKTVYNDSIYMDSATGQVTISLADFQPWVQQGYSVFCSRDVVTPNTYITVSKTATDFVISISDRSTGALIDCSTNTTTLNCTLIREP